MKVRGEAAPSESFSLEIVPKKPGTSMVRFYCDPKEVTEEQDGVSQTLYEWDEYHLEMPTYAALSDDINGNYDNLLKEAKTLEEENNKITNTITKLATATDDITDIQSALADVYELIISAM